MRAPRPAELVLGSVQLGLPYGAANRTGQPSRPAALRLVHRAADAGISSFDTARAYGEAEDRLGEALGVERKVHTVTKLAPLTDLAADAPRAAVRAAVEESVDPIAGRAEAQPARLSAAASRPAYALAWRRHLGTADRDAGRRHGAGARRFGAIARRSFGRARLQGCPAYPASVQSARQALAQGRRDRRHRGPRRSHHPCAQRLSAGHPRRCRCLPSGLPCRASMRRRWSR